MRKNYQNQEIETSHPAVPERVSVALAELTGELRDGLLALAVGAGMQVLAAMDGGRRHRGLRPTGQA